MDNVIKLYNENKLLIRAMDLPILSKNNDSLYYDCTTWIEEFELLVTNILSSISTTLIVPNIGIKNIKI